MNAWQPRVLSDVLELQRGHDLPSQDRRPGAVPVIGSFGVTGSHDFAKYDGPGVAIGRSGASIGTATFVHEPYWPLNTCLFVRDFKGNDARWIFHLLDSINFSGFNSGSAQPSLNRNFLNDIPVLLPPLSEQIAIAELLGALSSKIISNSKISLTARELGTAIFDKSASEVGSRALPLHSIAENVPGKYLAKEHYVDEGAYFVYGSNSVMGRHDKSTVEGGFAVLAKIGSYCGNLRWSERPAWINNNAAAIVPNNKVAPSILRHALEQIDMTPHRAGTGQPYIQMASLFEAPVSLPSPRQCEAIAPSLQHLSALESQIEEENRTLAALRMTLLPELMSGRLRVKDAEKKIEEVV